MPTIAQLPQADSISPADTIPISQSGTTRAASIGAVLSSAQPVITMASPALMGRISLGPGGPEQVDVGAGLTFAATTLVANGMDHADFPAVNTLVKQSDLVISNQGTPMLMPAELLLNLFSAGSNVAITTDGTISATASSASTNLELGNAIGTLPVIASLAAQDIVAVNHAGADCGIQYANLLDGITIDQAQLAAPASDTDTIWSGQGTNVMSRQTLAAVWTWIAGKAPLYLTPVTEITSNISLNAASHNRRILFCSQPVTLTPVVTNMGSGFRCTVINASSGNVTLASGFVTSSGGNTLSAWQTATIWCITYSGGTLCYASLAPSNTVNAASTTALPGQVSGLTASAQTQTSINLSWQAPATGGAATSYLVQYQAVGASTWMSSPPVVSGLNYLLSGLQAATTYNITVQASNAAGSGQASSTFSATTLATTTQTSVPPQVTGLTVGSTTSTTVQLNWTGQVGAAAATAYTVQYRVTGSSGWTYSQSNVTTSNTTVPGLTASTSYDFEVYGINSSGFGTASSTVTVTTAPTTATQSVTSISWNLMPAGPYTHGSGSIGVNAHVTPTTSPIQIGFSTSPTVPPTVWTQTSLVSSNIWGAYVTTPATPGSWYTWAEGLDGSASTVSPTAFTVQ